MLNKYKEIFSCRDVFNCICLTSGRFTACIDAIPDVLFTLHTLTETFF